MAAEKTLPDGRFLRLFAGRLLLLLFAGVQVIVGHFAAPQRAAQEEAAAFRRAAGLREPPVFADGIEEPVARAARAARRGSGRQSAQIVIARQGSDDGLVKDFLQVALRQSRRFDVGTCSQSVGKPDGLQLSHRFLSVASQFNQHLVGDDNKPNASEIGIQEENCVSKQTNKQTTKLTLTSDLRSA